MPASDAQGILRERLYRQRLAADPLDSPAAVVEWLGAMQAQEYAEAKWSIGERTRDCTDARVEEAFARGEILRTHLLRPTWHFVTPRDIRWMLRLTAPRIRAQSRYRLKQLQLDDAMLARSAEVIVRALEPGDPLTRPELGAALARAGIEPEGQRLAYIAMHAELEELICSGPRRGRAHTYALLSRRAPDALELTRDESLAELTRRYFVSRGPATVRDFTSWSSLTVADAKAGIASVGDALARKEDPDGRVWFAAAGRPKKRAPTGAFLIPTYDEMVMGYRELKVGLPEHPARGRFWTRPVVIDGRTVGSWKRTVSKREARIDATLLEPLARRDQRSLDEAVERFGRFNGAPGVLVADNAAG